MGRGREPFGNLVTINSQISKSLISQAAAQAVNSADSLVLAQAARIEIKRFSQLHHQTGRERTLVALDQVQVTGRYRQPRSHRGLGQPFTAAQTADGRSGKERGFDHDIPCHIIYNVSIDNIAFWAKIQQLL